MKINKKIGKVFGNARLMLCLIAAFGLFLRLLFFSGMGASDELVYSKTAYDISMGKGIDPNSTLTLSTRLGLIYPVIFFYKLLGINELSSIIFVLITSIASIILVFYFGRLLFNERTGLMAAFLLSFFPLDIVYSTKLVSDMPSAFFMALGVYIFLYSEIKSVKSRKNNYYIFYILSGAFIGIGYLIRESTLLIALFFIIYILYKKRIKKEYFLVPFGVLIIFIAESFLFLSLTGDLFFRTHASQEYLRGAVIGYNYFGRLDFPTGLFHYPWLILTNSLLSYFYILIFIAVLYLMLFRRKESYYMVFWFIALLLYLSFGSSSFTQYIPFKAADRYLSIITIPGILLLAVFLDALNGKKEIIKKVIMPSAISLLLIASIGAVYFREDRHILGSLSQAYTFLQNSDKTVYIDGRSLRALDYISKYDNKMDIKEYPNNLSKISKVYVVINRQMIRHLMEANKNTVFPKEINKPPKAWKPIKEIGREDKNKVLIYYIP